MNTHRQKGDVGRKTTRRWREWDLSLSIISSSFAVKDLRPWRHAWYSAGTTDFDGQTKATNWAFWKRWQDSSLLRGHLSRHHLEANCWRAFPAGREADFRRVSERGPGERWMWANFRGRARRGIDRLASRPI